MEGRPSHSPALLGEPREIADDPTSYTEASARKRWPNDRGDGLLRRDLELRSEIATLRQPLFGGGRVEPPPAVAARP